MSGQLKVFQDAKACLRKDPQLTDEQVAEAIGIPARAIAMGFRELDTIRQARRDVQADSSSRRPTPPPERRGCATCCEIGRPSP